MDSCASVEKMLRTIGLRSEWTTSGKEAIFRAKYASQENDPFQVYIIDWLMPDMTGQISSRKQEKLELQHFVRNRCVYQNYRMYCRPQAVLGRQKIKPF